MTEFFETRMGQRFYEHTLPELVRQVTRLADALERIADSHVRAGSTQTENEDDTEERTEDQNPPTH
jgi:hypothetical protein